MKNCILSFSVNQRALKTSPIITWTLSVRVSEGHLWQSNNIKLELYPQIDKKRILNNRWTRSTAYCIILRKFTHKQYIFEQVFDIWGKVELWPLLEGHQPGLSPGWCPSGWCFWIIHTIYSSIFRPSGQQDGGQIPGGARTHHDFSQVQHPEVLPGRRHHPLRSPCRHGR